MYNYEYAEQEAEQARREAEDSELAYNASLRESNRLRGVAREYDWFYGQVQAALKLKNWEIIESALKGCE